MRISFVRSGGFAAVPGLRIHATITLDPGEAEVTAGPSYRRPLDENERRQMADAACTLLESKETPASHGDRSRDAYQFDFTLEDRGRQIVVTAAGQPDALPSSIRVLVEWAGREAAAIARARRG